MKATVLGILVAVVLLGIALPVTLSGCGGSGDNHPLIERDREGREEAEREEIICSLSRSEAEARGADDFEVWLSLCG